MELRRVYESNEDDGLDRKESEVEAIANGKMNGAQKENVHSILNSVSKLVSQIKKPAHRRSGSQLNWFPRKKADSYLKRKIRLLQENEGMNLSLDETLGNANPHYTRIAREKIAAKEAAKKAMAARKAAMVEASWCRILRAARIQSKEAEVELEKTEKFAAEAFEAARAMGVMMYDKPDGPRKSCEVESYSSLGGRSTHTVTTSFETAFEVDREVMAAVKEAFMQFAKCPPSNTVEFKDVLWKISQNPNNNESDQGSSEISSESFTELVAAMRNRLKGLEEDELSSVATIVATCGLNAALLKIEHSKDNEQGATRARRISSAAHFIDGYSNRKEPVTEVPSLDKFLVKHVSRLEREVQEARKSTCQKTQDAELKPTRPSEHISDLGSILVKHVSKLEKEVQEARNSHKNNSVLDRVCKEPQNSGVLSENRRKTGTELHKTVASDQYKENVDSNAAVDAMEQDHVKSSPVKHLSRLERAKLEVLNSFASHELSNLEKILVKPVHRLEREKLQALGTENSPISIFKKRNQQTENMESLDAILVKHQSKLEKAKAEASQQPLFEIIRNRKHGNEATGSDSLDKILVRHQPEVEEAKLAAAQNSEDYVKHADARKEAREKELQEAWGGLSLGNSIRPHLSRLERERSSWKRAGDEERKQAREVMK